MTTRTEQLRQLRRVGVEDHTPGGARELLVGSLGSDPYQRIEDLRAAGERKARAEGMAYQLEHERHIVLARVASEVAQAHAKESLSEAKLERMARADVRYERHIRGTGAAIEERGLATSEYFAIRSELLMDEQAIYHLRALSRLEGTPASETPRVQWTEGESEAQGEPSPRQDVPEGDAQPGGTTSGSPLDERESKPRTAPAGMIQSLRRLWGKVFERIDQPEGLKELVTEALAEGASEADVTAALEAVTDYMTVLSLNATEQQAML